MVLRRLPCAFAVVLGVSLATCGSDGSGDPATTGPRTQAVEKLEAFGLPEDQAACIIEQIGAVTVVEATDLNAFTESDEYQRAADRCIADE